MMEDRYRFLPDVDRAIESFWGANRENASTNYNYDLLGGRTERRPLARNSMDGFIAILSQIVDGSNLRSVQIDKRLCLPGFIRSSERWEFIAFSEGRLIAAICLKFHTGSNFNKNFNNRCEEAIARGFDFWAAHRRGLLGEDQSLPFVGWLILVEDCKDAHMRVSNTSVLPTLSEFDGTSYIDQYRILGRHMLQERLYSATAVISASRAPVDSGSTWVRSGGEQVADFLNQFSDHIGTEAARCQS